MSLLPPMPEGFKDATHANVDLTIGFADRLRILFGWKVFIRVTTWHQNVIHGNLHSESQVDIYRPSRHKPGVATAPSY
jgi:hypothetical protein